MKNFAKILSFFMIVVSMFFGSALIVMLLWNAIMPDIFSLPAIGYWKAMGLFILCNILFKSPITKKIK